MTYPKTIRICEWSRVDVSCIPTNLRTACQVAAESWRQAAGLYEAPISFSGADGSILCTCQHVGVIEVDGITIEILPKLDAHTELHASPDDQSVRRVMDNLLWMLSSCGFMELTEADRANLKRDEVRYLDLFAYLYAKNLLRQLQAGVPHAYVNHEGDLRTVKGAINFSEQVTRNWNRMDRISCQWDEYTSDTALNRVLKCAASILRHRVENPSARGLLDECLLYFEDTLTMNAKAALQTAHAIRWSRANDRFRSCFELAVRLLSGEGFQMAKANIRTFVFLLDMNRVFEAFAGAVLQASYRVPIAEQIPIGHLLTSPSKSVRQIPDFIWDDGDEHWIGDAKYKRLNGSTSSYLDEDEQDVSVPFAYLAPADIRQLTVYAEIYRRNQRLESVPNLAVLYPVVGNEPMAISCRIAWNGSLLFIVPVRVDREGPLNSCTAITSTSRMLSIAGV